jgi:hypothetical protein
MRVSERRRGDGNFIARIGDVDPRLDHVGIPVCPSAKRPAVGPTRIRATVGGAEYSIVVASTLRHPPTVRTAFG